MATFLSKLFKPKWQNKHLPTRIDAIKELDANNEEQQGILYTIAETDPHSDARAEAIKKLPQSTQLIELHKKAEPELQKLIEQRLYELADSQSLTIFDLILDVNLLTEMIIKSEHPDVFIRGLAHIEDPASLLSIAQSSKTSKIRQAAAELIESEEQLQALTQSAKSKDKSVYQIAKSKLGKIRNFQKEQKETLEKIEAVLKAMEDHAATDNLKLYEPKLTSLLQRWEPLQSKANSEQEQRFESAYSASKNKLDSILKEQQEQEEQERLIKVGGDEQEATLLTLQDTLEKFRSQAASFQELSALDAIIKTQETRWLEATRHEKVDKAKNKHYQVLMTELRQYHGALKLAAENADLINESVKEISATKKDARHLNELIQNLNKVLKQINWPTNFCLPEILDKATSALGHSADVKAELAKNAKEANNRIQKLIDQLDQALEDRQIKQSAKLHRNIQSLLSQVDAQQADRIHNQLTLRLKQLNELRDWQGYASTPRQIELCETMERLADTHIEPLEKANRIKAMQKEWKSLGGASDRELWDRFKAAADKAYEPCKAFYDEQSRLKDANLERRKTLIQQLKEFIDSNDWDKPDWKAAEQINRKARLDWKDAYPIDFKANKPIQNEFNALLDTLDGHLKQERNRNETLKAEIVSKAEELVGEEDLENAISGAKALQQEWKSIGITDHKQDRKHWKAFRKACDQIFERRDQDRESRREVAHASVEAFEAFCTELDAFNQASAEKTLEELKTALADFRKQFKQQESLPRKKQDALFARFEDGIRTLKGAIGKHENQAYLDQLMGLQERAKLCRSVYLDRDACDMDAMEQQFNNANSLASNLESKVKALWISVKAGSVAQDSIISADDARSHCIRCEIAAGIDSPESDKELRMQLQVSRLSEGMSSNVEHQSREDQLKALLEEWYLRVGADASTLEEVEKRLEAAVNHLFG